MNRSRHAFAAKIFGLALAALLGIGSEDAPAASRGFGKAPVTRSRAAFKPMPVRSFRQLKRLLAGKTPQSSGRLVELLGNNTNSPPPGSVAVGDSAGSGNQHSNTNVQVEGVDEGDIVKTDGTYLYTVQGGQLRILRAYPANALSLLASVPFEDGFYPTELYLEGDRVVVIGNRWMAQTPSPTGDAPAVGASIAAPVFMGENRTVARVFNVADRAHPAQEREVAFTGQYVSSRKIGNAVYLVGRTYPRFYGFMAEAAKPAAAMTRDATLPQISDSADGTGAAHAVALADIFYFPGFVDPDYAIVAGFRLDLPDRPADVTSYLGAGDVVYASVDKLYLSAADYASDANGVKTHVYSFAIGDGGSSFRAMGEVPGTVLNQFSMDQHGDYFRIATTDRRWWQEGDTFQSSVSNAVYSLDAGMKVVGRLEKLAEGEQIYAARFMGDRAYLVTFKQVDPLFVIDLSQPTAPKVLGELKVPGFSNYLHPYDANHLLGIGQETKVEADGGVRIGGMKLALFDVSDVTNPVLRHSLIIGEAGTYSDALYDHKAVLFDKDRNLLAFPLTEMATKSGEEWPSVGFQGARVYGVTLDGGFKEQGAVSQMPKGDYYDWNRYIRRLLTIEDQLYSVSEGRVQANDLGSFEQTGGVDVLPVQTQPPVVVDPGVTPPPIVDDVACTQEAKICPDGVTAVGRVGPKCEFAACPAVP